MPKFVPRQRKHKVLARQKQQQDQSHPTSNPNLHPLPTASTNTDPNALILPPAPTSQSNQKDRKRKLREELHPGPISSKKQKRLDKYIENKLRKDEELVYLRLLEGEKEKVDQIRENARGRAGGEGAEELNGARLRVESRRKEGAVNIPNSQRSRVGGVENHDDENEDGGESEDSFEAEHKEAFGDHVEDVPRPQLLLGSGLARPLEFDENGIPIIRSRRPRKKSSHIQVTLPQQEGDENSEWEGFSDHEQESGTETNPAQDPRLAQLMATIDQVLDGEESEGSDGSELEESDLDDESEPGPGDSNELVSEDEDDHEDGSDTSETSVEDNKDRTSAFKAWATQQLNQSLGHTPSYEQPRSQLPINTQAQPTMEERPHTVIPILDQPLKTPVTTRKAYAVHVKRTEDIQQSRLELPIIQHEQEIMEAIHNSPVVIVKGDTGSGKTTQVPQFLYEAGFGTKNGPTPGMIGITQPRRVAAVSMAKRVADELGDQGDKVSHQIRFDSTTSSKTAVKFMTDGILLRELSEDLLLRKYSVIVIDEAHERSVNTDILIGLLSKIVPARMKKNQFNPDPTPLKLVIMSATLNIGDFVNDRLFPADHKPPVIEAEGRQHRVTTHFALRSRADYVEEVVEKVRRAHRKLPKGGMLVFLTGQNEIWQVQSQLQKLLGGSGVDVSGPRVQTAANDLPLEVEDMEIESAKVDANQDDFDDVNIQIHSDDEADDDEFDVSDDEEETTRPTQRPFGSSNDLHTSVHILPLYSQLPTKEQLKVFDPPPPNARLIILATNVAETSLTIPGIRYVFDTGRSKERKYNLDSGVQSFEIDYISKASAAQRAGRAGRTGPGHCWRLFTSAVYEQYFPDHTEPEILRAPVESVVLQLKSFSYPKPIVDFPFPSAPKTEALEKAERLLKNLGALTASGSITELGRELSSYPLSPRLGKIVSCGLREPVILPHLVALVAGLAVPEVFVSEPQLDPASREGAEGIDHEDHDKTKQEYGRARATLSRHDKNSDAMKLLTAVSMYNAATDKEQMCKDYFLRPKAMHEISQLQRQLTSIIKANHPAATSSFNQQTKLSGKYVKVFNTLAASGYIDQVAIRHDMSPNPPELSNKPRRAIDVPYLPLVPLSRHHSATLQETAIFVHPSSVLAKHSVKDLPAYVIYTHLQQSQPKHIDSSTTAVTRNRMFALTPIDRSSLVTLARDTALLELGKPVSGSKIEELKGTPRKRDCWVSAELTGGAGRGFGWSMPPVRVKQVVDVKSGSGWRVEEWSS